jgi:hypothetical protein
MTMKHIVRVSLFLTVLVLGWPAVARAQLFEPLRFTTSFAFQAGQQFLPAGTYVLAPLNGDNGGNVFTLSDTRTQVTFMMGDGLGLSPDAKAQTDEVIFAFDHAAGHYVMCQVWDSAEQSGIQVHGTYNLTQAAKAREGNAPTLDVIVPAAPAGK